jgi:hypothetical protein
MITYILLGAILYVVPGYAPARPTRGLGETSRRSTTS